MQPAHTPTVSLIRAADDDIAFLSALASDPAVAPFLAVGSGDKPALRALLSETKEDRGPAGLFVIRSPDGESLGGLALRVVNHRSRICELSRLMMRADTRRTGIASAAVRLACCKVLVDHALHRIQLEVYGDNLADKPSSRARASFAKAPAVARTGAASAGSTACSSGCWPKSSPPANA
jgi:RimJ/RimL family protein N-acetyltransferase